MSRASTSATSTKGGTRRDEIVLRVHLHEKVDRDLLSVAGANAETLRNLSHDEACAAALSEHGLSVITGADGTLEIAIDPGRARGKIRIAFKPE